MAEPIKCFLVEDTGKTRAAVIKDDAGNVTGTVERPVWRRVDTGEEFEALADTPVGAMWFAPWLDEMFSPQLEHVLIVKTPGGDWLIDGEARNCTMPNKGEERDGKTYFYPFQQDHHCWIIHGTPPDITVDKAGTTCGAGAGSIGKPNYHGFLRNGYLVEA
jgi:hypothetical protein